MESLVAAAATLLKFFKHLIQVETAGLLARRILDVALQMLAHNGHRRKDHEGMFNAPLIVVARLFLRDLEGVATQVDKLWKAKRYQRILPNIQACGSLLHEQHLPAVIAHSGEVSVVRPVKKLLTWVFSFAREVVRQVVAVEMILEGLAGRSVPGQQLFFDIRFASGSHKGRNPVLVGHDAVDLSARLDDARPTDHAGNAVSAFPTGILFTSEGRCATVRPREYFGPVVGRE